jgi:hypothetical protein
MGPYHPVILAIRKTWPTEIGASVAEWERKIISQTSTHHNDSVESPLVAERTPM